MWSIFQFLNDDYALTILDIGGAMTEVPSYRPLIDIKRARLIGFESDVDACHYRAGTVLILTIRRHSIHGRGSSAGEQSWRLSLNLKLPPPEGRIRGLAK